jgi:hypothetical protein
LRTSFRALFITRIEIKEIEICVGRRLAHASPRDVIRKSGTVGTIRNWSQFLKRFERSKAIEQLERLERTDPVMNGAKRLNDWNDWNWLP